LHLHPQVDAVEQRPGQPAQIAAFDRCRADAVARVGRLTAPGRAIPEPPPTSAATVEL
jgi:hypothetical protein